MKTSNGQPHSTNRLARRAELTRIERPTRNTRVLWVEKLKGADVQKFVVVSPKLIGYCTHYVEGRRPPSSPCFEDHSLCEGGHKEETMRENFLLQSWSLKRRKMVFLYLTPKAAEQLEDQVTPDEPLRGLPIIVERTSASNGRLNVSIADFTAPVQVTAGAVDPWESIMVYYKVPKQLAAGYRALTQPQRPLYGASETGSE